MSIFKRLTLRARIIGAIGITLLSGSTIYSIFNVKQQVELRDFHVLDTRFPEDLWFTPSGDLIAVEQNNRVIVIKRWASNTSKQTENEVTFAQKNGAEPIYSLRLDPSNHSPQRSAPYVVSADATKIAWYWDGCIYIQELPLEAASGQPAARLAINLKNSKHGAVEALSFSPDPYINLLYTDGTLETWNYDSSLKARASTTLDGQWQIWTRGHQMAISCFSCPKGDVALLDVQPEGKGSSQFFIGYMNGASVALSPKGQLAVGTKDGEVILPLRSISFVTESSRAINQIAFYDENNLVFAGDFPGIFLVEADKKELTPRKLSPSQAIRLLTISKDRLAVATLTAIKVSKIQRVPQLNPSASALWKVVLPIIGILGFILAVIRDQIG